MRQALERDVNTRANSAGTVKVTPTKRPRRGQTDVPNVNKHVPGQGWPKQRVPGQPPDGLGYDTTQEASHFNVLVGFRFCGLTTALLA